MHLTSEGSWSSIKLVQFSNPLEPISTKLGSINDDNFEQLLNPLQN